MKNTYILGISAFHYDASAAILCDGEIIAAAQEERFTRKKYDSSFPGNAIDYCLRETGISEEDIDLVVFHDDSYKEEVKKNCNFAVNRYSAKTTSPTPPAPFIRQGLIKPLYS
jgi:predicted NodU family carbamoyl transferase